jgi:RHS repeat-associated protein
VSSQQWQFDALGNWKTFTKDGTPETRIANAQNEYTSVGGAALGYSANGNLVTDAQGRTFEYDAWNRLVIARSTGGVLLASYDYDGLNRRITEQVSSDGFSDASLSPVRDMFYSSQWRVLEERLRVAGAVGSVAEARYVWSSVYIDAMILRDRGAERVYALQDGNWNTTGLIAASGVPGKAIGEVIQRMIYNPYGEVFLANTDWTALSASTALPWQHMFQGLKFTEATGLGYVRNRDYSASLGRFIELDPIGFSAGDNNWYRFVGNGPVNNLDPYGESSLKDFLRGLTGRLKNLTEGQWDRIHCVGHCLAPQPLGWTFGVFWEIVEPLLFRALGEEFKEDLKDQLKDIFLHNFVGAFICKPISGSLVASCYCCCKFFGIGEDL